MTILTDSARGCGQMKGKTMNNEQAALIAASQVVGGLVASGWFKTDVFNQIEKTTQEFKDRFIQTLGPEIACDYCGDELEFDPRPTPPKGHKLELHFTPNSLGFVIGGDFEADEINPHKPD